MRCRSSRQRVAVVQAKKTADGPSIAVVGVTGAVGQEFLQVGEKGDGCAQQSGIRVAEQTPWLHRC